MFGGQPSTPFGAPAGNPGPFGTQTNTTPFGGGSTFGATTTTPSTGGFGGFGGSAPAPSGFGGFGGAPAPAPGAFGTTPATTSAFGSPAAAPSTGFGTTATSTPFGAPAPSGGLFGGGAPAPVGGGMFGASTSTAGGFGTTPAPAAAFGTFGSTTPAQQNTFGAPSSFGETTTSTFGAPAPAPGALFGSTAPAPSAFGTTTSTGSPFGATAPAPGGMFGGGATTPSTGVFGAPAATPTAGGTSAAPYQATPKQDGTSSVSLQSITGMPQYEQKSFEELRAEDYAQGNKGDGGAAAPGGFGGFGSAAQSSFAAPAPSTGGLFGSTPAPAPSAFGGSAFGTPAPAPSGAFGTTGSAFGTTPAPAPDGAFNFASNTPAPAPAAFGSFGAKAPATAFGVAPAPAPTGLFGASTSPAPAPTGLGFGAAPAPATGFASSPSPGTGFFGTSAPAPSTGLFGTAPAPAPFGAAPSVTSPAAGQFRAAPAPSLFGSPAPAPVFGSPAPAGGGLFGAQPASPFGVPAPAPFGAAPAAPAGGLFGAQPATSAAPYAITGTAPANILPPTADAALAQQLAALENQKKELEQLDVWRGHSPKGSSAVPVSLGENEAKLSTYSAAIPRGLSPYSAPPRSSAQIRPRGFGPIKQENKSPSLGTLGQTPKTLMSPDAYLGASAKRLVLKPESQSPAKQRLLLLDAPADPTTDAKGLPATADTQSMNGNMSSPEPDIGAGATPASFTSRDRSVNIASPPVSITPHPDAQTPARKGRTPVADRAYDFYKQVVSPTEEQAMARDGNGSKQSTHVPRLTMEGYSVTPPLEELSKMSEADLAAVSGFSVSKEGIGSVSWDGAVDVRDVDIDRVVSIEQNDVAVYEEDESNGTKPTAGSKLNRPAVITIQNVFPKQGRNADKAILEKFERKISKQTAKMGAELIYYDSRTGEWKFRVSHFSRYALVEDDTDDESEGPTGEDGVNFEAGERGGRSREKVAPGEVGEDEKGVSDGDATHRTMDVTAIVSDAESSERILKSAEDAYSMFSQLQVSEQMDIEERAVVSPRSDEIQDFPDEGVGLANDNETVEFPPSEFPKVAFESGITARLAHESGIESVTASSTDFGMRMGRSFRVAWKADGSVLLPNPEKPQVLVQKRPIFTDGEETSIDGSALLQAHLKHASKERKTAEGCPVFSLPRTSHSLEGTPSSHVLWCNAVSQYISSVADAKNNDTDPEQALIQKRAFSLIMCLFGIEKAGAGAWDSPVEVNDFLYDRRVEAFSRWLKDACASDVQRDVRAAIGKHDVYGAILAALASDMLTASQIADDNGFLELSTAMSSDVPGREFVVDQVQCWNETGAASHIPANVVRIYKLIAGDLELEDQLYSAGGATPDFDWRRRLAMRLFYGTSPNSQQKFLPDLVKNYNSDVGSGVAPYPLPRYVTNGSLLAREGNTDTCVLYRLLQLFADADQDVCTPRLSHVISPSGYTSSAHDMSLAFHLACIIGATDCSNPLSARENASLIHSYAAQLMDSGTWEWSVYVYLCVEGQTDNGELFSRAQHAKNVILQNFTGIGEQQQKRSFLETNVGIPSAWFEEALADRAARLGNVVDAVSHLLPVSTERARDLFEAYILPNYVFMRRTDQTMRMLEMFGATAPGTIASAVFELFRLSDEIERLSKSDVNDSKGAASMLLENADTIQNIIKACKTEEAQKKNRSEGLRIYPQYRVVPVECFLEEALAALAFLKLQLHAVAAGVSIVDEQTLIGKSNILQLKVRSQHAHLSLSEAIELDLDITTSLI